MDFSLTQEQKQFAESVRRWVEKDYNFEQRKKSSNPKPAYPIPPGRLWPSWARPHCLSLKTRVASMAPPST